MQAQQLQLKVSGLPPQQAAVLRLAAQDFGIKATARALMLETPTIKRHRAYIFKKMHVNSMPAAVAEGFRRGILTYVAIVLCVSLSFGSDFQGRPARPLRANSIVRVQGA